MRKGEVSRRQIAMRAKEAVGMQQSLLQQKTADKKSGLLERQPKDQNISQENLGFDQKSNDFWRAWLTKNYEQLPGKTRKLLDDYVGQIGFDNYLELLNVIWSTGYLYFIHEKAVHFPVKHLDEFLAGAIFKYLEQKSEGQLAQVLDKLTPNAINVLYSAIMGDADATVDALMQNDVVKNR